MAKVEHVPNPRIKEREAHGPQLIKKELDGFNGKIAVLITNAVGTMWCAYLFAILALISLPQAVAGGVATLIGWIAQTFLQLVLLSVIMVGQKVAAAASDKQALQTYRDAEALLKIQDEVHRLIEINNSLTEEIHLAVGGKAPAPAVATPAPKAVAPAKAAPVKKAAASKAVSASRKAPAKKGPAK